MDNQLKQKTECKQNKQQQANKEIPLQQYIIFFPALARHLFRGFNSESLIQSMNIN